MHTTNYNIGIQSEKQIPFKLIAKLTIMFDLLTHVRLFNIQNYQSADQKVLLR